MTTSFFVDFIDPDALREFCRRELEQGRAVVPSRDAVVIRPPSGLNTQSTTPRSCPVNVPTCSLVREFQIHTSAGVVSAPAT